uniref:Signal recognition particle subunit SRP72 n=1 Tax=Ditylum brightwellii TaxID=49249 RepID=A0A7S1ZNJ0_9STRA|mmetsp:Transcript_35787/g.53326  ORF Transcript_35787/g.53326 Transcript_35787/m.53326 type:complete len:879 (+) Transcript_35787:252-2888(+)
MSSSTTKPKKHWKDQLVTLNNHVHSRRYHKCQSLSSDVLKDAKDDDDDDDENKIPPHIQRMIESIHAKSLLQLGKFEECIDFCKSLRVSRQKDAQKQKDVVEGGSTVVFHLVEEEVYALYRLGRYETCRDLCRRIIDKQQQNAVVTKEELTGLQHVYAQCLYRLHDETNGLQMYQNLVKEEVVQDEEEKEEIYANVMALSVANHSVSILQNDEEEEGLVQQILNKQHDDGVVSYDLLYNIATHLLLRSTSTSDVRKALVLLDKAKDECVRSLQDDYDQVDDDDEDHDDEEGDAAEDVDKEAKKQNDMEAELNKETAPIRANKALGLLLLGGDENCQNAKRLYEKLVSSSSTTGGGNNGVNNAALVAASNNLALVQRESLFDSWKRMPHFNQSSSDKKKDSAAFKTPMTTPMQTRIILYNRAILLYKMGKVSEANQVLFTLKKVLKQSSLSVSGGSDGNKARKKKKKGGGTSSSLDDNEIGDAPPAPPSTNADILFWNAKITILESELLRKEDRVNESEKSIQECLSSLKEHLKNNKKGGDDIVLEYTLAMLLLYQAQLKEDEDNNDEKSNDKIQSYIQILSSLPPKIHSKPGVIATLASLYNLMGDTEKASSLLEETSSTSGGGIHAAKVVAMGDFKFQLGLYQDAADLYESFLQQHEEEGGDDGDEDNDIMVVTAKLVRALSFVDEEKAEEYAARLPLIGGGDYEDDSEEEDEEEENAAMLDGEELEGMDIPRISKKIGGKGKRAILSGGGDNRDGEQRKKKNREAILRQRAKKREQYLKKLESEGRYNPDRPAKPDPERWIPKNQRSYNRRGRRGRNKFVGAQGGGTGAGADREAAKLDAAARAAERNEGGVSSKPSTAHMKVGSSGAVRKGGRRR